MRCVIWAILLLMLTAGGAQAAAKQVLLLNSYHPGYVWNQQLMEGMMRVFESSTVPIRLRYEYMDSKFGVRDEFIEELRQLYKQKYRKARFDVVIASDDDAFQFMRRYRDELFPSATVVFCGVNDFRLGDIAQLSNFTGTAEKFDLIGTLELALQLHPDAQHIALVGGMDRASITNVKRARTVLKHYFADKKILDVTQKNSTEVLETLRNAPRDTVVLYISYFLLPDGTKLSVSESVQLVAKAGLPMYSAWSYLLRDGMIGGQMLRGQDQGELAARMAMRILQGESAADMPVVMQSPTYPMFDGQALTRWGIERATLPDNSVILNDDISDFQRYKWVVLLILCFVLYQSGVIVWLLGNIRGRKRAEAQWKKEQEARSEAERQLFQSQKMETINAIAGGLAHDFNNIFSSISCCCELAMENLQPESQPYTDIHQALVATRRGKSMVGSLLKYSYQPSKIVIEFVDLQQLTASLLEMVRPILPAHVRIRSELDSVPPVYGNAGQILQVIMNLCVNAGQAMQDQKNHACIDIKLHEVCREGQSYVQLLVEDSGPGIPQESVPHIFEPFFTTKGKGIGTGLGLAVTQRLVQRHNGKLRMLKNTPQGVTFEVLFPLGSETAAGVRVQQA